MSNKEISNSKEKQPGLDNNDKPLEQQKYSYQRIDVDKEDFFEKIECENGQRHIETVLDAEKSLRIDQRKAAFRELSKETSKGKKAELKKTIAEDKDKLTGSLTAGLTKEQIKAEASLRNGKYRARNAQLTHEYYDPLINNFERAYHSSRPSIDELKANMRPEN